MKTAQLTPLPTFPATGSEPIPLPPRPAPLPADGGGSDTVLAATQIIQFPAWPQMADAPFSAAPPPNLAPVPAASPVLRPQQSTPFAEQLPPMGKPAVVQPPEPPPAPAPDAPDFTDADLAAAFTPILDIAKLVADQETEDRLLARFEPMVRATVRRALAEYNPLARPFRPPGFFDRFWWRMLALFTSRTYEEVLFAKTSRFQVEEVYLLDRRSLAMVSYASNDPARHASPPRVEATVQRLARQLRDEGGMPLASFTLQDGRTALSTSGEFCLMVAITLGTANDLVLSDLAYTLERIESRFNKRLATGSDPLLQEMQPYLEDCLLIQSPAAG